MNATTKREYSFDLLKLIAIAIAIIVLHHYQQITQIRFDDGINWFGGAFYWGYLVELFFMISGYFTYKSVDAIRNGQSFRAFFLRKYIRFLPMLIICGIACLILQYVYGTYFNNNALPSFSIWNIVASLLGIERWFDTALMVNNPMWYISVLLFCLIVFYFATRLGKNTKSLIVFYCGIVALGIIMRRASIVYNIDLPFINICIARGLICFFLGLVLATLLSSKKRIESGGYKLLQASAFVAVLIFFILLLNCIFESNQNFFYYSLCFIVYPALLILCNNPLLERVLTSSHLRLIGDAAYNMYLWHLPLIYGFLCILGCLKLPYNTYFAMYGFLFCCFIFGILSSACLDKPLGYLAQAGLERCRIPLSNR